MTTATTSPPAAPLRLDWLLPEFDATIVEHEVIEGDPEAIYRAVKAVDMAEIPKQYAAVRVLFAARGAAERLVNALLGRTAPPPVPEGALRLCDMPEHGDWVKLADEPPDEFAFGVVGRFWGGETVWETIDADHFVAFDRPGFAKIACSISLRPYGTAHTLVSATETSEPAYSSKAALPFASPSPPPGLLDKGSPPQGAGYSEKGR